MRKGVILEVDDHYVTLITPEGEYMRTHKLEQEYQIGEEIQFFPIDSRENKQRKLHRIFRASVKGRVAFLAAAVLFLAVVFLPFYQNNQVYAYMSIDVNPSIELGLNEKIKVVSLQGFNEEGEKIVERIENWKKQSAVLVAEKIIEEIERQGYFASENQVVITTVPSKRTKDMVVLDETISEIERDAEKEPFEITVMNGTVEDRQSAITQGVSTGAYILGGQGKSQKDQVKEIESKDGKEIHEKTVPSEMKNDHNDVKNNGQENSNVNGQNNGQENSNVNGQNNGKGNSNVNGQNNGKGNPNVNGQNNGKGNPNVNGQNNAKGNPNANGQNNGQGNPNANGQNNGQGNPNVNGQNNGQGNLNANGQNNGQGNPNANGQNNGKGNPSGN